MADRYVRSTDGSDVDGGTTWALARASLTGIAAIDTAGDRIFLSQAHDEVTAGVVNVSFAGTTASPTLLICGNDAAEPPNAVATTGKITTTGANSITLQGATAFYAYGLSFIVGAGAGSGNFSSTMSGATFEACNFVLSNTGASSTINVTGVGGATLKNCFIKFAAAGQTLAHSEGFLRVSGGGLSSGVSPTKFLAAAVRTTFLIEGFDFSTASVGMHLLDQITSSVRGTFRNCKMPVGWSGNLNNGGGSLGSVFEMFNCDGGDTRYRYRKSAQFGTIQDESTVIKTSGANDGFNGFAWKLVTSVDAEYPANVLETPEIVAWNETVGPLTVTVDILRDSLTPLTDAEVWLEVQYLGTSGVPLGSFVSDAKADLLASAANQTASSATWTTTGLTNPNKQQLSVTFTPQEAGYIHAVAKLAKASTTLYVDPFLIVS